MITYVHGDNLQAYQILFAEAAQALGQKRIDSLEEYFTYIKTLANIDHKYTRLPIDEEVFEINADTRTITIPNSFKNNGISVQGDEMAEIVYFKINRFFDATDLADDSMNIYIQWQNADGESGASKEWIRDIESEPGYIIFGWPITSSITKTSGTIKFSVRFYKLDSSKQALAYSFSTLTASVTVRPALDFDVTKVTAEDMSRQLLDRLVNSQLAGVNVAEPVFETNLNTINFLYNVATDGDEAGTKTLKVYCYSPNATGTISYSWVKIPADSNKAITENDPGVNIFEITKDKTRNINKAYYTKTQGGEYLLYSGTLEDAIVNDTDVYEMYNTFLADEAGTYYVTVTNTAKVSISIDEDGEPVEKTGTKSVESTQCIIPTPQSLEVISPKASVIISDDEDAIPTTIEVGQTSEDNEEYTQFSYQWKRKQYESEDSNQTSLDLEGAISNTYTPTSDGLYYATVTNTLNKATLSKDSNICRVTHTASKPTIVEKVNGIEGTSAYLTGKTQTLSVDVTINDAHWDDNYDTIAYQWYDYNPVENADDKTAFDEGTYNPAEHPKDKAIAGAISNAYIAKENNVFYCLVTTTYNGTIKETVSKRFDVNS